MRFLKSLKFLSANLKVQVRRSIAERDAIEIPTLRWVVPSLFAFLFAYLFVSVAMGPVGYQHKHFSSESGSVTALSGIFLGMACSFALAVLVLSRQVGRSTSWFWPLVALGFGFLALDEMLGFHEDMGDWLKASALGPAESFRNWNDVVVIGYGLLTIPFMIKFLPEIFRYPRFAELLSTAFTFYVVHTIIDSTQERTSMSIILEESAKVFSSAFFAFAMFIALLGTFAGTIGFAPRGDAGTARRKAPRRVRRLMGPVSRNLPRVPRVAFSMLDDLQHDRVR